MDNKKISSIIDQSIDNINVSLNNRDKFSKDRKLKLTGDKSKIDSTIFLNLILEIEKNFLNDFKIELNLMEILNDNIENNFSLNDLEILIIDEIKNVKY